MRVVGWRIEGFVGYAVLKIFSRYTIKFRFPNTS